MDPVSLGIAAAALLASKFGEEIATAAADSRRAIARLRALVVEKLGRVAETGAVEAVSGAPAKWEDRANTAERISAAAEADPEFADEVRRLVSSACADGEVEAFVAYAFDHARQVNLRGDNFGVINLG
ncbi:hypothetical protein [Nocardia bovistercoris]|uniref:Uncharacterized protein n=1 Tax=Nocardia bovistercoris TaxID=2785916 RepID=A0A931I5M3_9NOCA|nr:hypothetical protein [Nocardia bovistercoris]MBH0775302.1 hypothetical protein [Nocardia bovistercoris]